ncbi:MAG TPA: M14 family metallopeptidase [Candidatus Brocadiia bacterium]|nr:M14 family metallopeptidase [Candidatus Brocadiia bacterium]
MTALGKTLKAICMRLSGSALVVILFMIIGGRFPAGTSAAGEANPLAPYPTLDGMFAEITQAAKDNPGNVELITYGKSVKNRPLYCLRIHRGDGKKRPAALIGGNIHGDEWIANRVAMGIAKRLIEGCGKAERETKFLEMTDVFIAPCLNPDGYAAFWKSGGRASAKASRTNANGVDLNRNFPEPSGGANFRTSLTGVDDEKSSGYRGPKPYSEPETRAIRDLAAERRFFGNVNYHCKAMQITPAKATSDAGAKRMMDMAGAYQKNQPGVRYSIIPWPRALPIFQGNMEDSLYHEHGCMSILIELQERKEFEEKSPKPNIRMWQRNPRNPETVVEDNYPACLTALEAAFRMTGGEPIPAEKR